MKALLDFQIEVYDYVKVILRMTESVVHVAGTKAIKVIKCSTNVFNSWLWVCEVQA